MTLEADLEAADRKAARKAGWFVEKIMRTGRRGFPDRLYAKGGRVVFMEWKREGEPARREQVLRHEEMRAHGMEVHVVDSLAQARAIRGD